MRERDYKTMGTSIVYSPMSPPSLGLLNKHVLKDLANRWTDIVLLYRKAS